jgi:hypothetical protein
MGVCGLSNEQVSGSGIYNPYTYKSICNPATNDKGLYKPFT